jgi:hypothetical protein
MSVQPDPEEIALMIAADTSRRNLEQCLRRIRANRQALSETRMHMDKAFYDLARARELSEAVEQAHRELEARVHLLLDASEV